MNFLFGLFAFALVARVFSEESKEDEKAAEESAKKFESSRALRDDFMDNKWKAVQLIPLDTSGWIPDSINPHQESHQNQPKRRRIRKRKRRPNTSISTLDNQEETSTPSRQLQEENPWNEMIQEARIAPNKRRRVFPSFHKEIDAKQTEIPTEKSMEEEVLNLKALLKQAGSLSEILQRRNLTLGDLLKGEKKAIYALTEKPEEIEIITKPPEVFREIKVKTSFGNPKYNISNSGTTEKINKFSNVIVVDYKPNINEFTSNPFPNQKETKKRLPITNAKLNVKNQTKTKQDEIPKPYQIPISEILDIAKEMMTNQNENIEETHKKIDEPLRMSLDVNKIVEEKTTEKILIKTTESIPEKIKPFTAKDEIFEILKDSETKQILEEILRDRNMTINDLVELRERGSSQKHLADLFHNKTKEPKPQKEQVFVGKFINIRPSERTPKSRKTTENPTEETSEKLEETEDKNKYTITSFPTYKIEMDKKYKEVISEPIWKDYDKLYHKTHQKGTVENLDDFDDNFQTIEDEINSNSISEKGEETLRVDLRDDKLQDDEGNVFVKLPYGVKHAILASLLIIGVSLFVFLTILVIFKWSQKHKRKLCYSGSFSCSKFNSILENGERRTFRTFVSETLGKKRNFYKQQLQSMSDNWENDKKPFQ